MTSRVPVRPPTPTRSPAIIWSAVVVGLMLVVVALGWAFLKTPQLNADEEVLRSLDSLFTAVSARNEALLIDCEKRLNEMKDAGRIPPASWSRIDSIISMSKSHQWTAAAKKLYAFIEAQRATK